MIIDKSDRLWARRLGVVLRADLLTEDGAHRDRAIRERLLKRVKPWTACLYVYCTNNWPAYSEAIAQEWLSVGKRETPGLIPASDTGSHAFAAARP